MSRIDLLMGLDSDDPGDLSGDGHRSAAAAGRSADDRDVLLGHVGPSLRVFDHRLRLPVLVHRDRHDLFLYTEEEFGLWLSF